MKAISLVLALLCGAPFAMADNYPRQPAIDVQHYIFRVTLSDANDQIAGETTVRVRFLKDGARSFCLDLASAANGKGMTVSEVTLGGVAASFTHENNRVTISLSPSPKAGELREYTVKYHGEPVDGLKFPKNKFGERTFFSVNWPDKAHEWLPTVETILPTRPPASSSLRLRQSIKWSPMACCRRNSTLETARGERIGSNLCRSPPG